MVSPMTLFTPEDLLRYLYKESSHELTTAIERAMKEDFTLRERLNELQVSVNQIDAEKKLVAPRMEVVFKVLQYARETAAEAASQS
jgi:anti-sigma-K factor RskA